MKQRNKLQTWSWLVGLCGMMVFGACAPIDQPLPNVPETERVSAVKGNNLFAIDLYQKLRDNPTTKQALFNVFFSPYSISSALTMTYAGARGETANEMRKVLRFQLDDGKLHPAMGWLNIDLNNRGNAGDFQMSVANRLWGQTGFPFESDFLKLTQTSYQAGLEALDFTADADGSRQAINQWVENKTNNRIKDLLPVGSTSPETRLVLTNAIYFKGTWKNQFKKEDTKPAPFALQDNAAATVDVPMMNAKGKARYAETNDAKVLGLPYKGESLEMVWVVPKDKKGLPQLEEKLTLEQLNAWLDALVETDHVKMTLPTFKFTYEKALKTKLKSMGMVAPFGSADFSGITTAAGLFISEVFHKAFIEVNEEGSEAAAATAVVMNTDASVDPSEMGPKFQADRPFLFLIRDKTTNAILFMGRVANPKANES